MSNDAKMRLYMETFITQKLDNAMDELLQDSYIRHHVGHIQQSLKKQFPFWKTPPNHPDHDYPKGEY